MFVKQRNGKVYGAVLTKKEQQALDIELHKQMLQVDKEYGVHMDALILYTLYKTEGWGKRKLRSFWESIKLEHDNLVKFYEMPGEFQWLALNKLKEIGVDVEAWNEELTATLNAEDAAEEEVQCN